MQLPTASTHSSIMSPTAAVGIPQNYNSYFSPASHSRPIQINAPPTARYNYAAAERVMGLDFEQPSSNENSISAADSLYLMDFMDDENPPASSSITTNLMPTESTENALRRSALSTLPEDNKENGSSSSSTKSPPSSSPKKESLFVSASSATSNNKANEQFKNMQIFGEPGLQNFKRRSSYDDEILINEETESEAGFSGDDECMSNCGCVHSCIGSPIDFASDNNNSQYYNNTQQPFTRLGFKSIGDIIGYAQVVKAERLEALAELRNAVEKFNDMRQRKNQIQTTKFNPTN
jgi:hypothetical protein